MKETIYKIIGKRGRTTIPTSFRTALKITNDTVLEFRMENGSVIITPLRKCKNNMCEVLDESVPEETATKTPNHELDETLEKMLSVLVKKFIAKVTDSK